MSNTMAELIVENLKSVLTTANGFTAATVRRWSQIGLSYEVVPCLDIKTEGVQLKKVTNAYEENELTVAIDITHQIMTADSETAMDALVCSCLQAIMADTTRGGYALETVKDQVQAIVTVAGQPEVVQTIILKIRYRNQIKHPDKN